MTQYVTRRALLKTRNFMLLRLMKPMIEGRYFVYTITAIAALFAVIITTVHHNFREFTARVLVAASSLMPLLSVPEPIQV